MIVNVIFLVVILLVTSVSMKEVSLGCTRDGARERCFSYHDEEDATLYRIAAVDFCAAHNNASLAIIDNAIVNGLFMTNIPGRPWIRLRLVKYEKWIHASTTEEATEYIKDTLEIHGNDCAMFSTRDGFKTGRCDETHGYLCGRSWTSKGGMCPGTLVGDMCAVVGTRSAANWYTARYHCAEDHNSDLLSVDINPEYSDILNGNLAGSPTGSTYWIDVTNQLWAWKDGVNGPVLGHMKFNNWQTGHPITRHDCAVVELSTGRWESVTCQGNEYPPVCEQVNVTENMEPFTRTKAKPASHPTASPVHTNPGQGNKMTVIIACSVASGVFIVVITIIVVIVTVISRRNIARRDTQAGDTHHESTDVPGYAEDGKGDVTGYIRGDKGDLYAVPLKRLRTQNPNDDDPNAGSERGSVEFEVQENALYSQ